MSFFFQHAYALKILFPLTVMWANFKLSIEKYNLLFENNNLFYPHQSAYRSCHSPETALIKIVNDIFTALDDSHISLQCLLDLSTAFDNTGHETLLSRLHHAFSISDAVLSWFRSYLFDRTPVVSVNGNSSSPSVMKSGVQQGSVPGPILFVLYTQPLSEIVHHHSLSHNSQPWCNPLWLNGLKAPTN